MDNLEVMVMKGQLDSGCLLDLGTDRVPKTSRLVDDRIKQSVEAEEAAGGPGSCLQTREVVVDFQSRAPQV